MAIRRRITTRTRIEEIDNSVDRHSTTNLPTISEEHLLSDADTGTSIGSPESMNEEVFGSHPTYDSRTVKPTVGRTFADLIIELKNDHRAMAVVLTAISFLIFITKINSIEDFIYPLLVAVLLNAIWFGVSRFKKKNKLD